MIKNSLILFCFTTLLLPPVDPAKLLQKHIKTTDCITGSKLRNRGESAPEQRTNKPKFPLAGAGVRNPKPDVHRRDKNFQTNHSCIQDSPAHLFRLIRNEICFCAADEPSSSFPEEY